MGYLYTLISWRVQYNVNFDISPILEHPEFFIFDANHLKLSVWPLVLLLPSIFIDLEYYILDSKDKHVGKFIINILILPWETERILQCSIYRSCRIQYFVQSLSKQAKGIDGRFTKLLSVCITVFRSTTLYRVYFQ